MANKILLTGATGFIGRNVWQQLQHTSAELTLLVRPGTDPIRYKNFEKKATIVKIDLSDIATLRDYLADNSFDTIIHIGALRGGRKASKLQYRLANVDASEQLMINAMQNDSKFIFCSSVGVFGAIPMELPANNFTARQPDNYYHSTKIQAEKLLQKNVLHGLKGVIVRPAITYGVGDFGFPYTLVKLIDKKILRLPDQDVIIHLTNVETLAQAFLKLAEQDFQPGSAFNVADKQSVKLYDLADFISRQLHQKKFSNKYIISKAWFELGEKIASAFHNELWISRFQLISKSWYYDVSAAYQILGLKNHQTIPDIKIVTDWYQRISKHRKK